MRGTFASARTLPDGAKTSELQTGTVADIEGGVVLAGMHHPTAGWFAP
jgi:hypothetical protein